MRTVLRKAGFRIAALLLTAGLGGVWSCASAPPDSQNELDRAVEDFVDGDYRDAVTKLDAIIASSQDDPLRREAYMYLGRSHMALGETDEAIDAFTRCIHLGDTGPCVEYLRVLQQYMEGKPGALHMNEALTRGQLAGAVVRMFLNQEPDDPTGPTPLTILEQRGWMPVLPDGDHHAADPVTPASLYVVAARILAEAGQADQASRVMPGGYRKAASVKQPVSGSQALAVLERVRAITAR
jgi:tetratricopeptide (TPR) repeat protein